MLNKSFWTKINQAQAKYNESRRIIISEANKALHLSKQAIFALHRDNTNDAKAKIAEAEQILIKLEKDFFSNKKLRNEGAWSAGVEEFVEANLFLMFIEDKKVDEIKGLHIEPHEYIGGLSDYTGELMRQAILLSSKRKFKKVDEIAAEIQEVVQILLEYNLTGYMRTKFDQAKKNLNKIEQILYEINLKAN